MLNLQLHMHSSYRHQITVQAQHEIPILSTLKLYLSKSIQLLPSTMIQNLKGKTANWSVWCCNPDSCVIFPLTRSK